MAQKAGIEARVEATPGRGGCVPLQLSSVHGVRLQPACGGKLKKVRVYYLRNPPVGCEEVLLRRVVEGQGGPVVGGGGGQLEPGQACGVGGGRADWLADGMV